MSQPYEVFLSFKNLDENNQPTRDKALAVEIFKYLTERDLKVFMSIFELEAHGISNYKQAIDEALDQSQVLVAVATSVDHLKSGWVMHEWDSFCNDIISNVKPHASVFTYVEGIVLSELPRSLRRYQAVRHGEDSLEVLYRFVKNAIHGSEPSTPPVAKPVPTPEPAGVRLTKREAEALSFMLTDPQAGNRGVWTYPLHQQLTYRGFRDAEATAVLNSLQNKGFLIYREVESIDPMSNKPSTAPALKVTQAGFDYALAHPDLLDRKDKYIFHIVLDGTREANTPLLDYLHQASSVERQTRFIIESNPARCRIAVFSYEPFEEVELRSVADQLGLKLILVEQAN